MTSPTTTDHPALLGMRSTLRGIFVNVGLVIVKATAGLIGHSYALIADSIESAADVVSSCAVWWGLRVSAQPADENHPLGHGKAEPLAGAFVSLFLFGAAAIVAYQAIQYIIIPHPIPHWWTLLVLAVIITTKEFLFRYVMRVGEETNSGAVKGDALHHRSDALTSGAAFIGISIALIGNYFAPNTRWATADDWAALFASGVIAYNGFCVLKSSVYELSDAHPDPELESQVRALALSVPGVRNLHKCFIRKMGFDYYVELDVRVQRDMPVHEAHAIAHQVQDAVRAGILSKRFSRVLVHIEPA